MDEIITNERGARQSRIGVKFTDFSPEALLRVGRASAEGFAKYGAGNWQKIDQTDHIDHAINHLLEYQAGNTDEDHLAHAVCRALFAMGTEPKTKEGPGIDEMYPGGVSISADGKVTIAGNDASIVSGVAVPLWMEWDGEPSESLPDWVNLNIHPRMDKEGAGRVWYYGDFPLAKGDVLVKTGADTMRVVPVLNKNCETCLHDAYGDFCHAPGHCDINKHSAWWPKGVKV